MSSTGPSLHAREEPPQSVFLTFLEIIKTCIGKIAEAGLHSLALMTILGLGWIITQTFVFEFFVPAILEMISFKAKMWIAGTVGALILGPSLYAMLTGTFFAYGSKVRPYGTRLWLGLSWILPSLIFGYGCTHGADLVSTLLWASGIGGCLGALTSSLIPLLDAVGHEILPQTLALTKQVGAWVLKKSWELVCYVADKANTYMVMPMINWGMEFVSSTFSNLWRQINPELPTPKHPPVVDPGPLPPSTMLQTPPLAPLSTALPPEPVAIVPADEVSAVSPGNNAATEQSSVLNPDRPARLSIT